MMKPGAQLRFKAADWLRIDSNERSMSLVIALLLQEAGAPHVHMTSSISEMRYDVRHVYHRPSASPGPRLENVMLRLLLLYPAKNGVEIFGFDADGPHLVAKRGAVYWEKALEDWQECGAVGKQRTMTQVRV